VNKTENAGQYELSRVGLTHSTHSSHFGNNPASQSLDCWKHSANHQT